MPALIGISVKPKDGSSASASVPVDLLSEEGVPPAEGDDVSFSVDGKVTSVSGSTAEISIDAINGEPVSGAGGEEEPEPGSSAAMRPGLASKAASNTMPLF